MTILEEAQKQRLEERKKKRIQTAKDMLAKIDALEGEVENHQDAILLAQKSLDAYRESVKKFDAEFE